LYATSLRGNIAPKKRAGTIAAEKTLETANLLDLSANSTLINLCTFLIIIVPFYHGAVRHLFATYIEDGGSKRIKNGALLADFFLLFVEGYLSSVASQSTRPAVRACLMVTFSRP
jgi:hypothetical protein